MIVDVEWKSHLAFWQSILPHHKWQGQLPIHVLYFAVHIGTVEVHDAIASLIHLMYTTEKKDSCVHWKRCFMRLEVKELGQTLWWIEHAVWHADQMQPAADSSKQMEKYILLHFSATLMFFATMEEVVLKASNSVLIIFSGKPICRFAALVPNISLDIVSASAFQIVFKSLSVVLLKLR